MCKSVSNFGPNQRKGIQTKCILGFLPYSTTHKTPHIAQYSRNSEGTGGRGLSRLCIGYHVPVASSRHVGAKMSHLQSFLANMLSHGNSDFYKEKLPEHAILRPYSRKSR
ncbi:hypothetical protein AVEN_57559-1 [Araneus ventricosus]|uniref:Uncharacterized protein n=1 Tax=Araneus ventricosus TaxID=182803 RepID=A0A4Y2WL27_ARAVE|nr:hypothetical protein AVEN_57559-1 [Araneus ventricosus]